MAKAPWSGHAKTRLCPPLTVEQAAALSEAFLRDITETIALAVREAAIAGHVACAPAGLEPLFHEHLAAGTRLLLAAAGGREDCRDVRPDGGGGEIGLTKGMIVLGQHE